MTRPPLTPPRRQALAVAAILLMILAAGADKDAGQPPAVRFDRDILPVLSDHCFQCHGPDAKARKGDLRLDLKEDALRTENPVIVPGKSVESELIARIESADPDEVMPPPKSNHALTKAQIATLRRWIDAGATWGKHWSFVPPTLPEVPAVGDPSWARNPIDRFILARLDAEGLKPSPEAAKTTLIRRVTLDLIGLPPTPAEVAAFLADDRRNDAYERVIDRLLASPHYGGERHAWDYRSLTPRGTPTATAIRATTTAPCGPGAIGSSMRSTTTSLSTSSPRASLPATFCPIPPRSSRPDSVAIT